MGKRLTFLIFIISFSLAEYAGTIDKGTPQILRDNLLFTASTGVRVYPTDTIVLTKGSALLLDDEAVYVEALKKSKVKISEKNKFSLISGKLLFASKNKFITLTLFDSDLSLTGVFFAINFIDASRVEIINNSSKKVKISKPQNLEIGKNYYTIFDGKNLSTPAHYSSKFNVPSHFKSAKSKSKDTSTTAWLSAILPGLGHIYTNSYVKGSIEVLFSISMLNSEFDDLQKSMYLAFWLWSIVDSVAETNEYNEQLKQKKAIF